jgi:hypothetical protein
LAGLGDLTLKMYQSFWDAQPERTDLGEQVFLNAAAAWDTAAMVASSRKMFNLVKSSVWARVAAWSEWVQVGLSRFLTLSLIVGFWTDQRVTQRSPQPSPDRPFAETAPSGSLRISTTLLSTTARPCATSDHLWLRLQILISAGDLEEAYRFAREEGFGGSLARAWWRMEAVPVIFGRMAEKGKEVDWEGEWSAVEEVLKGDKEV